jgi:hypothetical protein
MKIVLRAFGDKLSGVMEVPEDTGGRFRLAMVQPIQVRDKVDLMVAPIQKICVFEWTGKIFSQAGHSWDGAREYQLVGIG